MRQRHLLTILMMILCAMVVGCKSSPAPAPEANTDTDTPPVQTPVEPTGFTADQVRSADDMPALREAARGGDPNAMFLLGREHFIGRFVPRNMEAARAWFEQAHEAGSVAGTNALGVIYYESLGVDQNNVLAMALFSEAAAVGNAKAMRNIGRMYEGGNGMPADNAVALSWYEKAFVAAGEDVNLKRILSAAIARVTPTDEPQR
jgi:hypothetical protein